MQHAQTSEQKMEFIRSWIVAVPIALTVPVLDQLQTNDAPP
jgi:hypothetical protein